MIDIIDAYIERHLSKERIKSEYLQIKKRERSLSFKILLFANIIFIIFFILFAFNGSFYFIRIYRAIF